MPELILVGTGRFSFDRRPTEYLQICFELYCINMIVIVEYRNNTSEIAKCCTARVTYS